MFRFPPARACSRVLKPVHLEEWRRPPDVKRISTWPEGPLDVLNLTSKSEVLTRAGRGCIRAARGRGEDVAPAVGVALVRSRRARGRDDADEADAAADVVIADDGLDVVRAEGERR